MSFARKSGVWYSKKLIVTARQKGINLAKIYSTILYSIFSIFSFFFRTTQ